MAFAFRRQPLTALYLTWTVLSILLRLPFWALTNALPSWRPRRAWSLKRTLIVYALRALCRVVLQTDLATLKPPPLEASARAADKLGFVFVEPVPDALILGEIKSVAEKNNVRPARVSGYWYGARGPKGGDVGQPAAPDERVIYHLHGGGHVSGTANPKAGAQQPMYDGFVEHFGPGARLFALDYRLASAAPLEPANAFPASLLDALAGYRYLVEDVGFEPRNIILSGDSAGGGIALNLARYLALAGLPPLPIPGGLILISPTLDWAKTHTGPESSMCRNSRSDYVHGMMEPDYVSHALVGNLPVEFAAKSAWISPGSRHAEWERGMFSRMPPTILVAGNAEYTLDGMQAAGERLAADMGTRYTYCEVPDAAHECISMSWHEPERTTAFHALRRWADDLTR